LVEGADGVAARDHAGRAANRLQARSLPQDRTRPRPDDAAHAARPCRRGDRVRRSRGGPAGLRYLAFRLPVAPHAGQANPPAPGLSSLVDPCHPQSQPQSTRRRPSLAGPLEPSCCFRRRSWACAVAPVRARLPIQAGSRLGSGLSSLTGATSAPGRDGDGDVFARARIKNGQGHRVLHITNRRPTLAVPSPACGKAQSQ
jgi:hypothetical protein